MDRTDFIMKNRMDVAPESALYQYLASISVYFSKGVLDADCFPYVAANFVLLFEILPQMRKRFGISEKRNKFATN